MNTLIEHDMLKEGRSRLTLYNTICNLLTKNQHAVYVIIQTYTIQRGALRFATQISPLLYSTVFNQNSGPFIMTTYFV